MPTSNTPTWEDTVPTWDDTAPAAPAAPVKAADPSWDDTAPVEVAPQPTPDEPGLADEFSAIGRGLNRGVRRFVQQGSVTGLRRPAQLEDDIKAAEAELSSFDAQWQGKPDVTGRLKQLRDNQVGKIAALRAEMQRYAAMAPDLAKGLSEQQAAISKLPPSQAQDEFDKAEGFFGKLKAVARNPVEMVAIVTAESAPSMIGPIVGSVLGPVGTAAGAATSSFTAESSANVIAGMQQAGVDATNPEQVLAFFRDRARLDPVAAKADLKALGPATFDALTAGFAGKILKPFIGKGAGKVAAATAGEIGMQMAGGAAGSIASSKLGGEDIDWGDVILEMLGELGPTEAITNVRGELVANAKAKAKASVVDSTAPAGSTRAEPVIYGAEQTREQRAKNRVFSGGSPIRVQDENKFNASDEDSAYRLTGQSQIDDLVESGFLRPKEGKIKGGRSDEVHWSKGGGNLAFTPSDNYVVQARVSNNQMGALGIGDLSNIWKWNGATWEDVLPSLRQPTVSASTTSSSSVATSGKDKIITDPPAEDPDIPVEPVVAPPVVPNVESSAIDVRDKEQGDYLERRARELRAENDRLESPAANVGSRSDEEVGNESTESLVARTKVGTERDSAFSERAKALKRVALSLNPGDVIIYDDGSEAVVDQVMKNGDIFVVGGGAPIAFLQGYTVRRKSNAGAVAPTVEAPAPVTAPQSQQAAATLTPEQIRTELTGLQEQFMGWPKFTEAMTMAEKRASLDAKGVLANRINFLKEALKIQGQPEVAAVAEPAPPTPAIKPAKAGELELLEELEADGALSKKDLKRLADLRTLEIAEPSTPTGTPVANSGATSPEPVVAGAVAANAAVAPVVVESAEAVVAPAKKSKKAKAEATATAQPSAEATRPIDIESGTTFGPAVNTRLTPYPDNGTRDQKQQWVEDNGITKGSEPGNSKNKTETKRTLVVRDEDTGKLYEVGVYNNPNATVASERGKKGSDLFDFLRKRSGTKFTEPRYAPVATLRYMDGRKGIYREITQEEINQRRAEYAQSVGVEPVADAAVTQVDADGVANTTVIEESQGAAKPEAKSELWSWLQGQLKDQKTGKLRPITPDMALDLATQFSEEEPEAAADIGVEIGQPLVNEAFLKLKRSEQSEIIRQEFARRIYEVVRRQYEAETGRIGQGDQSSAGQNRAALPERTAIDLPAAAESGSAGVAPTVQPEQSSQPVLEPSIVDSLVNKLESMKVDGTKLFLLPDAGLSVTIWNGTLTAAQLALRAGRSVTQAVQAGVDWLRSRGETFNEDKVREALNAAVAGEVAQPGATPEQQQAAEDVDLLSDPEAIKEINKGISETKKRGEGVFSKVHDAGVWVADRMRITPERVAAATARAKALLIEAGFAEGDLEQVGPRWKLTEEAEKRGGGTTYELETAGQNLADIIERELKNSDPENKAAISMLLGSARVFFDGDSITSITQATKDRIKSYAQGEVSLQGLLLGMQSLGWRSVTYVGRNMRDVLRNVYAERFGENGEVERQLRRAFNAFRAALTPAAIRGALNTAAAQDLYRLSGDKGADIYSVVEQALANPFYSTNELAERFAKLFSDKFGGLTAAQQEEARKAFLAAMSEPFKAGQVYARSEIDDVLKQKKTTRKRSKKSVWQKVEDAVNAGMFDPGKVLERQALENGFEKLTDEAVAQMRSWVKQMQQLSDATPEQALALARTPEERALAKTDWEAFTTQKRIELKRQIETKFLRLTEPLNLKTNPRAVVQAAQEWASAVLLLTLGFPVRQSVDVLTQTVMHSGTSALGHAFEMMAIAQRNGQPVQPTKEIASALFNAFKAQTKSAHQILVSVAATLQGTPRHRNVEDLIGRVAVFERAQQAMQDNLARGEYAQATMNWLIAQVRWGRMFAAASDSVGRVGSTYQNMRQQAVKQMRLNGLTRAQAEMKADEVMGDISTEWKAAIIRAQALNEIGQTGYTPLQVKQQATDIVQARIYEKMRSAGLDADAFKERNNFLGDVWGWNEHETKGPGGVVASGMRAMNKFSEEVGLIGLPLAGLGRFANSIATGVNRVTTLAGGGFFPQLYGAAKANIGENGIAENASPWYRTPEQRNQRKVEAAIGMSMLPVLVGLAATGVMRPFLRPPKDERERELWLREHTPYTVEFYTGDGKKFKVPMRIGPMALVAPYLAGIAAYKDATEQNEKEQDRVNAEAARKGLTPGKVDKLNGKDIISIIWEATMTSLLGGRTAGAAIDSMTDYGTPNVVKTAAGAVRAFIPGVPAWQEMSRWMGVRMDPKKASFMDFLVPLESSPARAVNMLGDNPTDPKGLGRIMNSLGLPYYDDGIDSSETEPAYVALANTGYRPPAINARKAYEIAGEWRPMNQDELSEYTQRRGTYLKEAVNALGEGATEDQIKQAYTAANVRALNEVGVTTGQPSQAGRPTGQARQSSSASYGALPSVNLPSAASLSSRSSSVLAPNRSSMLRPMRGGKRPSIRSSRSRRGSRGRRSLKLR